MQIEYITAARLRKTAPFEAHAVVAMPATDPVQAERSARLMARRAGVDGLILVVYDEERNGFINTCNLAFKNSRSHYFAYVAQDAFAGRVWLKVAQIQLEKTGKGMLAFNDGKWQGQLASFGMVSRTWAERHYNGDLFFPLYHSHYADAELTLVAKTHDQLCYAPRSVMIEVDWEKEDKLINDADRQLFRRRVSTFFDGRVPDTSDCRIFPGARPGPSSVAEPRIRSTTEI